MHSDTAISASAAPLTEMLRRSANLANACAWPDRKTFDRYSSQGEAKAHVEEISRELRESLRWGTLARPFRASRSCSFGALDRDGFASRIDPIGKKLHARLYVRL